MNAAKRSLAIGVAGVTLLCAAPALAQTGNSIGPAGVGDFRLQPRERIVEQPRQGPQDPNNPQPQRQAPVRQPPRVIVPAPPIAGGAPAAQPGPAQTQSQRTAPAEVRRTPAPTGAQPVQPAPQGAPQPQVAAPVPVDTGPTSPQPVDETAPEAPRAETPLAPEGGGYPTWLYAIPVALLALLGLTLWRRRRARAEAIHEAAAIEKQEVAIVPAKAVVPRADPIPRPWLELDLTTIRASFDPTEALIEFELRIANDGGSAARNLKIDVKMFNAGAEQDQQIGSFFRTAGRDQTRLSVPGVNAGQDGVIRGEVGMPLEEMKAVKLDGRMLFIPVIAVNILYEWGDGRTGQSAKSYVVGRELEQPSDKMGAFRVDQGPRVWRTIGQRQHKLARRV